MGDVYTPTPPKDNTVETYKGFDIVQTWIAGYKYYEVVDDPGSEPGSLEEYVYWDIGGGGMADNRLSSMKETIDDSI